VNPTPWQGSRLRALPMRRLLLATLVLLTLLPAARAVAADNTQALLVDACRDERVDGTYSQATYRRALAELPADSDQYTACRDVINRARLAALNARRSNSGSGGGGASTGPGSGGGTGTAGGGGTAPSRPPSADTGSCAGCNGSGTALDTATPDEQKGVKDATSSGAAPVRIGGQLLKPGAVGALTNSRRPLPTPLIVLLAALAACMLAGAGTAARNRVLARRPS
jgi:hypothetical protein